MDARLITELAARLDCPRQDNPRYAADCVVRAIMEGAEPPPPGPWIIVAGIGTLSRTMLEPPVFAPAAKRARLRLGDAAHAVAHPVAVVIDAVAGTNLRNCGGCAERRRRWNGEPPSP